MVEDDRETDLLEKNKKLTNVQLGQIMIKKITQTLENAAYQTDLLEQSGTRQVIIY